MKNKLVISVLASLFLMTGCVATISPPVVSVPAPVIEAPAVVVEPSVLVPAGWVWVGGVRHWQPSHYERRHR